MSFAATSKSAACGKRALILSAAVLAGLAVLFGGAGGAGAAATALCTTTTSAPTATPNSTLRGTPITYTATVTASAGCANGFPTGSVGFYSNYVIDGQPTSFQVGSSVTLVPTATPGVSLATLVDNSLPAGSFAITSSYTSDNEALFYDSSSATGTSVTVSNPTIDKTKIDFTLTPSTTTVGQSVSFSVQLTSVDASGNPTGVVPTGTVDFSAGPTAGFQNLFASFQLDSTGSIAFTYNGFVPGDYVVIASYPGDGANAGIEGELQLHVLAGPSAIPTTTTIAANPDTFQSGQTTTLSAHVAESGGGTPPAGGEVDFFAGTSPTDLSSEGSALIDASGNASVNVGNFPAGTYVVRAQYLGNAASDIQGSFGDSTMFVSTSSNGGGQDPTSTSYTGSVQAASLTEVTLTGHLDKGDGTPLTGEPLTLTLGSQKCTTAATLGSGDASCAITISQPAGQYPVTASFAGDSNWQASSGTSTFTVLQAGTSVAYTGATTGTFGSSAALAATLTDSNGSPVSGETVHLTMDGKSCDGITNGSGVASCSVAITENPAAYPITVTFGGDSSYSGSSTTSSFTVTPATTATTYTGATQSVQGGTVTLSAHVDGAPDGGMVTFTVGAESCTGTVSSGNASCQVTIADAPGSDYTVTATYAGDAAHLGSTDSKPFTVVAPTTTTRMSSIAPFLAGSAVTLGATVS
ncbi:MAG: Ig-like domain repeat protein, partial [Gaiellaceae bacterium]